MGNPLKRLVALGVVGGLALLVGILVIGGGSDRHDVYVTVDKATGVLTGQHVRAGGSIVGKVADITPVDRGRRAKLKLSVDDDVWPLPRGSRFTVRWGGTISLFSRYIALERGPEGAPAMVEDGGELPASALRTPVDYGELLNVFDEGTRRDLKTFLNRSGLALKKGGPQLRDALAVSPGVTREADAVLGTLDRSRADVEALVLSTGKVVDAVDRADPGLRDLVVGAGTTMNALAADVGSLKSMLEQAPGTFRKATGTLARADGTLRAAQDVTRRIAPGVTELRKVASPLNAVMGGLLDVGPDARATLATAGSSAPDLTGLLTKLTGTSPQLTSIAKQADVALNCIRPYTPEIVSLGSLWSSALAGVDGMGKYIRATPTVAPAFANNASYASSKDVIAAVPGTTYAFPRPPGTQAGQPWLLPECSAGKDAFDPAKDPESRSFNQLMQIPESTRRKP